MKQLCLILLLIAGCKETVFSNADEKTLEEMVRQQGVKKTMEELIEASEGGSAFDCHQSAHWIGRYGFEIEKEEAFRSCNASCHSGCYHGAMEAFLNQYGTADLAGDVDRICTSFESSFNRFECYHGSGHGVLAYVNYDLPAAIKECEKLGPQKSSCLGGVFMENVVAAQGYGANGEGSHSTDWVNHSDPYFPCNGISQEMDVQQSCYLMQTSWMLYISNYNFNIVATLCQNAPADVILTCFQSFGRDAAGHTLRDPPSIKGICELVPKENDYYERCVTGATHVIVDFWGADLKDQAAALCQILDERGKQACYQTLSWRLRDIFVSDEQVAAQCAYFEDSFKHLCEGM